jgi:putative membrane protein
VELILSVVLLHVDSFAWSEWVFYPEFLVGWVLFGAAYILFAGPLRHRFEGSRPVPLWQAGSFAFAMLVMLLALQGPLHELSDYFLFSAHMVQHLLIMLVMPPFLLLGLPDWMVRPVLKVPGVNSLARLITRPVAAFLLVNLIFGVWHFPAPYDLMMRDHSVHVGMHLMIMAVGVILWWPVMSPLPELPRIPGPVQMLYLFVLGIPMMVVAVVIAFADTHFYTWYAAAPRIFPLSVIDDQRLGALIMWVPGALVMWLGITFAYFRWSRPEVSEDEARVAFAPPAMSVPGGISPPRRRSVRAKP